MVKRIKYDTKSIYKCNGVSFLDWVLVSFDGGAFWILHICDLHSIIRQLSEWLLERNVWGEEGKKYQPSIHRIHTSKWHFHIRTSPHLSFTILLKKGSSLRFKLKINIYFPDCNLYYKTGSDVIQFNKTRCHYSF